MPLKTKKTSPKTSSEVTTKKFIVEEKEPEEKPLDVKPLEEKIEVIPVSDTTATKPEAEAVSTLESLAPSIPQEGTPPLKMKDESKDEGLKTVSEKDTLHPSNLSSFSLLDEKKEPTETKTMQAETPLTSTSQTISTTTTEADLTTKSSQDQVNKWIENYDEKEVGEKKKSSGFFKPFLIVLTVLSLIAIITGGIFYYQKNVASNSEESVEKAEESTAEPTTSPEPTATPTEEMTVDYSKYTLQILNGSGIPGEAGSVQDLLNDLDFKSVAKGNATSYDFEQTTVALKEGAPDQVFTDISKALSTTYDVASKSEVLKASSSYDVVVTVGIKK